MTKPRFARRNPEITPQDNPLEVNGGGLFEETDLPPEKSPREKPAVVTKTASWPSDQQNKLSL